MTIKRRTLGAIVVAMALICIALVIEILKQGGTL